MSSTFHLKVWMCYSFLPEVHIPQPGIHGETLCQLPQVNYMLYLSPWQRCQAACLSHASELDLFGGLQLRTGKIK